MPRVGSKHFAYTAAGRAKAAAYAERTGMPMEDEMESMGKAPMMDMRGANQRRYPKARGRAFKPSDSLVSFTLR